MKKKEEKIYKTSNFHIAVWLLMNGISFQKVDWSEGKRRAQFVFEDFKDREVLVQDFFKQEQLQSYISNSQELKARMYAVNPPIEYDRSTNT